MVPLINETIPAGENTERPLISPRTNALKNALGSCTRQQVQEENDRVLKAFDKAFDRGVKDLDNLKAKAKKLADERTS
jgi:hypothetical protein